MSGFCWVSTICSKGVPNMGQSAIDTTDSGEAGESRDHDIRGNGQIKSTQVFFEDLRQGMLIKGAVEVRSLLLMSLP